MSEEGRVCAAGRLKQAAALYRMSPKSLSPGQRGGRTILMSLVLKPKPHMTSFGLASAKALHEVVWAGLSEDFVTGVHNVLKHGRGKKRGEGVLMDDVEAILSTALIV